MQHLQNKYQSQFYLIILFLYLLIIAPSIFAGSVNLVWDGVSEAAGYRVSYGTASAQYTANLDSGPATSATVTNLTDGIRYYFAVRAYAGSIISDYSNEVNTIIASITIPPIANFTANGSTASSLNIFEGQTVTLVDTSTGTVASRAWDLGDGTSANTPTVVQSYTTAGTKTVLLAVTGAGITDTASKLINVLAPAPIANFSASPVSGTVPLTVKFTDTSLNSINSWSWNFGNGGTSATQSPSYTYTSAGIYTVSLTATGPGGSNTTTKSGYISANAPIIINPTGLVAAYGFDETSGTQALDSSGNGNDGILSGVTRSTQAKFGQSLSFNGSNSLVTVGDSNSLDLTRAMTLSAWVYPTTWANNWKAIIMKESKGGLIYSLYSNSDKNKPNSTIKIRGYERELTAGSHLPSNVWTHLAATYDGITQRLYINGKQVGSRAQTGLLDVSANPLRIGGNTIWTNEYFQGLIDEVRIYNRALSRTEIVAISQEPVVQSISPIGPCAILCSVWDNTTTPTVTSTDDRSAVELGMKFSSNIGGTVVGARFYKGVQNIGTHVARLWNNSGQLLAQATFINETASGWQQVNFPTPVTIAANNIYIISYHTTVGFYSFDYGYFLSANINEPLRALADGENGGNGVYRYGSGGVFPTNTYNSANYWVDVLFKAN